MPRTDRTIAQVLALFPGEPVEVDSALRSVRLLDHQEPPDGSMSHHPVAIWPGLLDQVRQAIRTRHYSYRTEEAYIGWIRRFVQFNHQRDPVEMGAAEVSRFLTLLAVDRQVAASTQNQALAAILSS